MTSSTTRRTFLKSAPVAAAAGLSLSSLAAQAEAKPAAVPYQLFSAQSLDEAAKALQASPGNKNLIDASAGLPVAVVMTTETAKSAKEFEWHEGRDHILLVIEGSTTYEVGGTPTNGRNTKPGEWLAPASEGATRMTLHKGDMLVIPRNTPHKRSTESSVTFFLISPMGAMRT
ncbi:MAG: hypothetical protein KGK08_06640 [Acidobacteriota bacterium]|nr:hypothetical protein [Acidobacteriota bacterium]